MKKINYYNTYEDDFVESQDQNYELPEDYKWIHNNFMYNFFSWILYKVVTNLGYLYCKIFLHIKIQNRDILKPYKKQGYFLYGNHTQPVGDVFVPTKVCKNKRAYFVANSNNLKVKIIGKILPMLGILPIPNSSKKMRNLIKAIETRIEEKNCVVIYPEAHVWPYYTKIRPFSSTPFKFPVENKSVSFCATTTYYKRKLGKKPGIIIYVDGPFLVDENLSKKENQEKLCNEIYNCMKQRSESSNCEYIEYIKKGN